MHVQPCVNLGAVTGGKAAESAAGFGGSSGSLRLPEQIREAPAQSQASGGRAAGGGQSAQRSGGLPGLSRYPSQAKSPPAASHSLPPVAAEGVGIRR